MIHRPRFRAHYQVQVVESDLVVLLSEAGHVQLTGRACAAAVRLIDDRRTPMKSAACWR